jgi:hypothetical protein
VAAVRIALLLAMAAACAAPVPLAPEPPSPPTLRLLGCAPATPLPRTATDLGAELLLDEGRGYGEIGTADLARQRSHPTPPPPGGVPRVIAGSPTVSGSLDKAVIERAVLAQLSPMRACYVHALAGDPTMTGSVTVSFTAGPDSRVTLTGVLGRGVTPAVQACIVRVIQSLTFPAGQTVTVTYPFELAIGGAAEPSRASGASGRSSDAPWTPFALADEAPPPSASLVARATEGAIRRDFAAIAGCFAGPAPIGSLRAMISVRGDGSIESTRTGGLGHIVEACVAQRLVDLRVAAPVHEAAEIACDFARGEARPWRVAPIAGYTVIEASERVVRHGHDVVIPGPLAPRPLPANQTFLILAGPDTTGAILELAVEWTEQDDATLLALRDGARAPLVVGVARTAHQIGGVEPVTAWPALRIGGGTVTACIDRASTSAPLSDAVAVDTLIHRVAARCRVIRCSASLGVMIDTDATASQLFDVAGAARRAGFARVLLGSYAGCPAIKPARPAEP